jgi:hypothetical protein
MDRGEVQKLKIALTFVGNEKQKITCCYGHVRSELDERRLGKLRRWAIVRLVLFHSMILYQEFERDPEGGGR